MTVALVVNIGSLEKRSNQLKCKEQKTRSPNTTAKLRTTCNDFSRNISAGHNSLLQVHRCH